MKNRFPYTKQGYLEAKKYLDSVEHKINELSTDGYTITKLANEKWLEINSMKIRLKPEVIKFLEQGNVKYQGKIKTYLTMQGNFTETEEENVFTYTKTTVSQDLKNYQEAYNILMDNFNSFPEEDKVEIHKQLEKLKL